MTQKHPLVSIIIPCYNREQYIAETLSCVQKINYPVWECIVVDNNSTDKSTKIIQEMAYADTRIHFLSQHDNNISTARNMAVAHSSGKYILPLDSDDLIHADYVKEAVEILENDPEIAVVSCDGSYFGTKRGKWGFELYKNFDEFLITNCLHNTSMYRRTDFDRTDGYDSSLRVAEDWDFWISILQHGGKVVKIEKNYFFYRRHNDSTYLRFRRSEELEDAYRYIYLKHKELYSKLLNNPILLLKQRDKYKKGYNQLRKLTFRKPLP